MVKLIQRVCRANMLEMIEEVRTARYASWSAILLRSRIREYLQTLGGIAGEW